MRKIIGFVVKMEVHASYLLLIAVSVLVCCAQVQASCESLTIGCYEIGMKKTGTCSDCTHESCADMCFQADQSFAYGGEGTLPCSYS